MSNYRREDVKVVITSILGSFIVEGYAAGDFLSIEPDGEGWTETVGSHNTATRNRLTMPGVMINLKLHGASESNNDLEALWRLDKNTGSNPFTILVKDVRSDTKMVISDEAYIKNTPPLNFGEDIKDVEWIIRCLRGEIFHGSQLSV